ncbi:MAG: hypothetical protein R3282_08850 [Rhodothermales bacterium]|nr:hypothetical protein [Rhodothermales bacterium]
MTDLFRKAVEKVESLPKDQQDAIAAMILEELADEERWNKTFERTPDVLERLAREAEKEAKAGRALPLDPDNM